MIIFGWGSGAKVLGEGFFLRCPNCGNATQWQIVETSKKFSLYFVPIAKWSTGYWLVCPVRSNGVRIASHDVAQAVLLSASRDPTTIPQSLAQRLLACWETTFGWWFSPIYGRTLYTVGLLRPVARAMVITVSPSCRIC